MKSEYSKFSKKLKSIICIVFKITTMKVNNTFSDIAIKKDEF